MVIIKHKDVAGVVCNSLLTPVANDTIKTAVASRCTQKLKMMLKWIVRNGIVGELVVFE